MNSAITMQKWLVIAALMTAVTILAHELAHYLAALALGASDVHLHWANVAYDANALSGIGAAAIALAGPALTHAIILWAWLSRSANVAVLALGLGAASRNIVVLPFAIKSLLGRDVSGFSGDETRAAAALELSPLIFASVAVVLGVGGLIVFLRRGYRTQGAALAIALFLGTVLGIVLWNLVGPMVLSGGRGYA